jgi:hypothetical protein
MKAVLLLGCLSLVGCSGGGGGDDSNHVGPCVHEFRDPVLNITSANSAADDARIGILVISNVTFNSSAVDLPMLFQEGTLQLTNLEFKDNKLICSVPCGFGTTEGLWQFDVSAAGFVEQHVSVQAGYAIFQGGCPSYNDNGTRLKITMQPTAASQS